VIDKDSLKIKEFEHVLIAKSATFCDHAQATDRFSIPRVPPMALLAIAAIPLLERRIVAVMVWPKKRQPFPPLLSSFINSHSDLSSSNQHLAPQQSTRIPKVYRLFR
jgi:hypothetical protein